MTRERRTGDAGPDLALLLHERDTRERVFESFPDAVLLTDVNGEVRDANRAALALLGRPAEVVIGRPIDELVVERPVEAERPGRLTRAGLWKGPVDILRPTGGARTAHARSMVLAGEDEPMHLLVLTGPPGDPLADALVASEERLSAIVDSATDAIVSADEEQRIVLFNAAAEEMFRCSASEALGQPLDRFIPERLREDHRRHVEGFATTGQTRRQMGHMLGTLMGVRADGEEFPIEGTISRISGPTGTVLTAIVRDATERTRLDEERDRLLEQERQAWAAAGRTEERVRRLQAIADAALVHLSLDDLFEELLGRLRELLGTDSASVLLLDREAGLLRVRANHGLERDTDEMASVPLGVGVAGRIAKDARPAVIEDLRQLPAVSPFLRRRLRSLAGVPIIHEGKVTGVLHVGTLTRRAFGADDVALLEIVASRLAPAIENARLHEVERRARELAEADSARLRLSQAIASALSRVRPIAETAQEIVRQVLPPLGAVAGAVLLLDEQREQLRIVAAEGYPTELLERFGDIPMDASNPLGRAVLSAEPVLIGSREERDRTFRALAEVEPIGASWAVTPVITHGHPIGVLALSFPEPRRFAPADVNLLQALADQCAQAVDRARAYERERAARREAETVGRRLALLQSLTAAFSSALTSDEVAEVIVTKATSSVGASSGVVMLLDASGRNLELRAAYGYPSEMLSGWELFPTDLATPVGDAVRTGGLVVVASPSDAAERYPAIAGSITGQPLGATVAVPIAVEGRMIGAIAFSFPPDAELGPGDEDLLAAVGRHAGQAFDRARLFELEHQARREAERARSRTERMQTLTERLSEQDSVAGVQEVLAEQTLDAHGAIGSLVMRIDPGGSLDVAVARGFPPEIVTAIGSVPIREGAALAEAAITRAGVWLEALDGAAPAADTDEIRRLGYMGAFAALPVRFGDRLFGVLAIQCDEPHEWELDDQEYLQAVVRQCAQAWSRAELHETETAARQQLHRSERRYRSLVQATSAVEWTVDPAGAFVEPQASWEAYTGQPWEQHRGFGWVNAFHPEDRTAVRSAWFSARDANGPYVAEARLWHAASGEHHVVVARAAPVRGDHGSVVEWVGTIVDINEQREGERRSLERERASRVRLELASERLAFLAEASAVLAGSLVVDETLQRLAELSVPRIADWCAVDLRTPAGGIQRVAVAHVDPAKVELAWELSRRYPPDPAAEQGLANVLRTGRSEFIPEITEEMIDQAPDITSEIAALIRELRLRSAMVVPLRRGERIFGAITFVWAESGRRYTDEDLALAEDLAQRAGVAIESASLYEAEHLARREEEEARERLRILAEAGEAATSSLDTRAIVSGVTQVAVRGFADWAAAFLIGRSDRVTEAVGAHRDPGLYDMVQRVITVRFPEPDSRDSLVARVLATGEPALVPHVTSDQLARIMAPGEQLRLAERLGFASALVVPLSARGRTLGALAAIRGSDQPPFDTDDASLAVELGRRTALALDNARLYGERQYIADTLQRSLLPPDLPAIPGMEIGARYLPASEGTSVGGDFYDVFEIDLDHWAAVIGDVVGKGPAAAAMMGLARYTIRTAALNQSRPSAILDTLNEAILRQTSDQRFCTACCVRFLLRGDSVRMTVSSGGHPLPLVLRADGTLETAGHPGTLLGVFDDPSLTDQPVDLAPGDALVLYTDGVTDERNEREEFGDRRLGELLVTLADRAAQEIADAIVDAVVSFRSGPPRDDIALLVLRRAR